LQTAVADRGGISKLRCLHARNDNEVLIDVELGTSPDAPCQWRYVLGFKPEGKGAQRILISSEEVWQGETRLFSRPDKTDRLDAMLLTQTRLEQIGANAQFRELADFFGATVYLHLVPQLLKFSDRIGGQRLEDDPFGQGFLEHLAKTNERTRTARLTKISKALALAVPQFKELRYALLLLEEPEISLNDAIVKQIPLMLSRLQRDKRVRGQIFVSTHSEALLSNPGIDGRGVILLQSSPDGSKVRTLDEDESRLITQGFSVAEVVLPKTRPTAVDQLGLF
jgi:hypothetical protein